MLLTKGFPMSLLSCPLGDMVKGVMLLIFPRCKKRTLVGSLTDRAPQPAALLKLAPARLPSQEDWLFPWAVLHPTVWPAAMQHAFHMHLLAPPAGMGGPSRGLSASACAT